MTHGLRYQIVQRLQQKFGIQFVLQQSVQVFQILQQLQFKV